jgi:hypothetical protein
MNYKELNFRSKTPDAAATEIMYEIATARADGIDLFRINFSLDEGEGIDGKKIFLTVIKLLKNMKQNGNIHFFATHDSFTHGTTEAVFLKNKYPDHYEILHDIKDTKFVYIKL